MVFAISCDDIFVEDISGFNVVLKAPSAGWKGKDTKVSFRWEQVPDAVNYQLEVVTPGFSVNHLQVFEKSLMEASFDTILTAGDYEWRIRALNSGSSTDYSYSSFTIQGPFNIGSKQVILKMPDDQFISNVNDVDFSWEALEGASYYSFKIKKSNWMGDSVIVTKLYSTSYRFPLEDGLYAWGVAAIDTSTGKATDYTIRSIVIDKNPPPVPRLVNPANKDTLNSLTASFNWHPSEPGATYQIEVYSEPELKNKIMGKTISDTTTYINLEKSGYYYWKVKAIDGQGNSSNFSPVSVFCIVIPPDIDQKQVVLMSPADESMVINKKVTLWWNMLSGAQKYSMQIVSPTFAHPLKLVYDQLVSTNSIAMDLEPGNYEWRVKAINTSSESTYCLPFSFTIYNTDLSQQNITLLRPLYGELVNGSIVKFSWERINSSASYHLLIKKDSWETGTVVQELNTDKTEIELPFLNGEYFWGLKAVDPQNSSETAYSVRKLTVDFKGDLTTATVSLVSPADNSMINEKKVTLWWDPISGAEKYNLQVVSPSFSNSVKLVYDQLITTNSVTLDLEPGSYEWRVKALNTSSESAYSPAFTFSINNTDLSQQRINLLKPLYGELVNNTAVKFSWERINSSASYHLLIKKDSWESGTVIQELKTDKTEIELPFLNGDYYWGIKAVDSQNSSETAYSVRKLVVDFKGDLAIIKVSLVSPVNSSTLTEKKVTLWWNPISGAEKYNLQVVSPSFSNSVKLVYDQLVTTNSVTLDLEPGSYEWRVKAQNSSSESAYCLPFSFSIYNTDLSQQRTILLKPLPSELTNNPLVSFAWEKLNNNAKYNLTIKKDSWESGPIVRELTTDKTESEFSFPDGKYYWGIKAIDPQNGSQTAYTTREFTVDMTAPEIPMLKAPVNNQVSDEFLMDFSWEPSDANDTKLTYTIEMYQVNNNLVTQLASKTTQQKSVVYNLEMAGKYKWRVNARDNAGNQGAYSEFRYFEIRNVKDLSLSTVSLLSPANRSTVTDKKVTFWWNPLAGADKYNLQIVSPSFSNPTKLISDQWVTTNSLSLDLEAGTYEWRVKAANSSSETNYSQFSLSIYNIDLTLQKTTLIAPLYAATVNRSMLKFSWEKLNANATYHLIVRKDSWESGTVVQELNTANTEFELSFLDGEYYWGVKAIDPQNGSQTAYTTRKFIVDVTAPEIPKLKTPLNNLVSTDYLLDFSWEPADASDTKLTYTLEMYQIINNSAVQMMSKTTQQKTVGYNLESPGKYKWRVYATDIAGNQSAYSEFRYFDIK
ncbi:MAG TPA: hypothetical protein VK205_14600 [Prolixibacteraceae bacterium]|nr:hypothetical protein [Prolixibacteraceae bacterium]